MRRPGIEPGSQEWESCMIPLHQRRTLWAFGCFTEKYPGGIELATGRLGLKMIYQEDIGPQGLL